MEKYVVTLQTFSKTFAMCGFRIGYACASRKLIQAMSKTHTYITLAPNTFSQLLALKALTIEKKYIERI